MINKVRKSVNRRTFLTSSAGYVGASLLTAPAGVLPESFGAGLRFRYSICNEVFEKWDFAVACRAIKSAGYTGIEISPFTLAENADQISTARRRELRNIMRSEGLTFVGLHWLLVTPKDLHVTTADREVREKSWAYFRKVIDLCADLGDHGVMVFGSPKQRASQGNSASEARENLKNGLASMAPHAKEQGVLILIEALPKKDTDVINTLDEAERLVNEIHHPSIQTMFDFHNTVDETEPMELLVKKHFSHIRHVHINEMDGRYPGTGKLDYVPVFKMLASLGYAGWISLEVFDFKPSPTQIAREAMDYMRKLDARIKA